MVGGSGHGQANAMAAAIVLASAVLTARASKAAAAGALSSVAVTDPAPVALRGWDAHICGWELVPRPASAAHALGTVSGDADVLRVHIRRRSPSVITLTYSLAEIK